MPRMETAPSPMPDGPRIDEQFKEIATFTNLENEMEQEKAMQEQMREVSQQAARRRGQTALTGYMQTPPDIWLG